MIFLISNQPDLFSREFINCSLNEAISRLSELPEIGNDTETQGLDCRLKGLLTIQLGNDDIQFVFDISSYGGKVPKELVDFMNEYDGIWILQNAKFDLQFYYHHGIFLKNVYDTMLVEYILTIGLQQAGRDLATLCEKYLGVNLDKSVRGQIITKGLSDAVIRYAAYDVVYLGKIKRKQMASVKDLKLEGAVKLDNEFVKVLAYVEYCGIKLDWAKWKEKSERELEELNILREKLNSWLWDNGYRQYFTGINRLFDEGQECTINWSSSKQLIPLFESLGINCNVFKKGEKKKSVDSKNLAKQKDKSTLIPIYLEFSAKEKQCSTYGLSWKKNIHPITGRIHTKFTQILNTGRMSSGGKDKANKVDYPNLQNLPSDHLTRSCFIAEPGCKICAADYSSQEQRVLANFSKEENLLGFYRKGLTDMHSYIAFLMYPEIRPCDINDITNDTLKYIKKNYDHERKLAKNAGFAIHLSI